MRKPMSEKQVDFCLYVYESKVDCKGLGGDTQ